MDLIAFFSNSELISAGLLAGEPTKGPLLKTVELLKPARLLLLVKAGQERSLGPLRELLPAGVALETLLLEQAQSESMSTLIGAIHQQRGKLAEYRHAALLNSGTPQERAALWILKHDKFFEGVMTEPPVDYSFIPAPTPFNLKAAEPAKGFGENDEEAPAGGTPMSWANVAIKVGCLGHSPRFQKTMEDAAAIAGHPTPVLLTGETGCGKEVLAHFIHALSPRSGKPFVAVNCAALPETLAESILFGHEKGAFTGAYRRQKGKFELADGGTLFLDELGELSLANQAKLLRVIETHFIDPLGGAETLKVDVRIIAATNRNLQQEVSGGRFREDLYYRLRAGEIDIPSLRERAGDIPIIALHLLGRFNATLAYPKQFSKAALKFLESQRWPGNVRDLMNTIERATLLCPRTVIEPEDFKIMSDCARPNGGNGSGGNVLPALYPGFSVEDYLQKMRREIFDKALTQANGNKSEAARLLGLTPQAVHKYLKVEEGERALRQ